MKELLKNEFFHGFLGRFFVFTLKKVDPEKKFVMISGKAAPSSCFCENACAGGKPRRQQTSTAAESPVRLSPCGVSVANRTTRRESRGRSLRR